MRYVHNMKTIDHELMTELTKQEKLAEVVNAHAEYWRGHGYNQGFEAGEASARHNNTGLFIVGVFVGGMVMFATLRYFYG